MSIISQNQQDEELFNTISGFFKTFKIGDLLRRCNACKQKGVPVLDIFKYKLCNVFSDRSMYMQMKTNSFRESFSKNTFYLFLNSANTNWLRFTTLLSKKVIDSLEPLTSGDRINAFIVDDSLFERTSCKKTELGAKVFDHCDRRYKKGFRLLSLLWTATVAFFLPLRIRTFLARKNHLMADHLPVKEESLPEQKEPRQ